MGCLIYLFLACVLVATFVFGTVLCSVIDSDNQPTRTMTAQRYVPQPEDSEAVREAVKNYERCAKDWRDDSTMAYALCGGDCTVQQLVAIGKLQGHICAGY